MFGFYDLQHVETPWCTKFGGAAIWMPLSSSPFLSLSFLLSFSVLSIPPLSFNLPLPLGFSISALHLSFLLPCLLFCSVCTPSATLFLPLPRFHFLPPPSELLTFLCLLSPSPLMTAHEWRCLVIVTFCNNMFTRSRLPPTWLYGLKWCWQSHHALQILHTALVFSRNKKTSPVE